MPISRRSAVVMSGVAIFVAASLLALQLQAAALRTGSPVHAVNACGAGCAATARENTQLKAQVAALTAQVHALNSRVRSCNLKLSNIYQSC